PPPRCPAGLFAPAADGSPLPAGPWLEAEWPKLVHADHHLRIARARGSFTVGDGIQVLNAGLLRGLARDFGRFPGRSPLKADTLLPQHPPQPPRTDVLHNTLRA